jgi:hypothetical protein
MTDLESFAREIIRASWDGCDGGDIIQEIALKHRLIRRVSFDSKIHEDPTGGDMEPGDPWFVFAGLLARTR